MNPLPIFLTAEWRNLVLLNFAVDPDALADHVPPGTELDFHQGQTYLSIVGFQFLRTSICGVPALGHRNFSEVNLRFYVRRQVGNVWRRGVVFLKEIVPRRCVTWIANTLYGENYVTRPMESQLAFVPGVATPRQTEYRWCEFGTWNRVGVTCADVPPALPTAGSLDKFIIEHYWGYSGAPPNNADRTEAPAPSTSGASFGREYAVEHPPWEVVPAESFTCACQAEKTYGSKFAPFLNAEPQSAFFALGSKILVRWGTRISTVQGSLQRSAASP